MNDVTRNIVFGLCCAAIGAALLFFRWLRTGRTVFESPCPRCGSNCTWPVQDHESSRTTYECTNGHRYRGL